MTIERKVISFPGYPDHFRDLYRCVMVEEDHLVFEAILSELELEWREFGQAWQSEEGTIEIDEDRRIRTFRCLSAVTSLPPSITQLSALQELDLNGTLFLRNLPPDIGNLDTLVKLNIFNSGIISLPPSIGRLQNLRVLNLLAQDLKHLPEEIGNLNNLIKLNLQESGVRSLPSSIGRLQALEELNLCGSKLRNLPEEIGYLGNLVRLNLSCKWISLIPSSIGHLQALRELLLCNTRNLTSLPEEIGNLSKLTKLNVIWSGITSLPSSIERLKSLRFLWLSGANIPEMKGGQDIRNKYLSSLLQRCTSIGWLDCRVAKANEYILAHNRYRSRIALIPVGLSFVTMESWPSVLENATRAFRVYDDYIIKYESQPRGLKSHDAIFRILMDYQESFAEALLHRNK